MKKATLTLSLLLALHGSLYAATKEAITTTKAPSPIGTYSQAIKIGKTVHLAGQIGVDPITGTLVSEEFKVQVNQALVNLRNVAIAAGGDLDDIVKLTVFVTDLKDFASVNQAMQPRFHLPYPARSLVEIKALPKNAKVEIEAIMHLS